MDWLQVGAIILGNLVFAATLFLWNRSESRNDFRLYAGFLDAIHTEMKDFHGRLCSIEERTKK